MTYKKLLTVGLIIFNVFAIAAILAVIFLVTVFGNFAYGLISFCLFALLLTRTAKKVISK